jgi:hypothetical protein
MPSRVEVNRAEVLRLMRRQPFRPFYIRLESGDRLDIEHPENIAFDPGDAEGDGEFHVISRSHRIVSTFAAVTAVAAKDEGESRDGPDSEVAA